MCHQPYKVRRVSYKVGRQSYKVRHVSNRVDGRSRKHFDRPAGVLGVKRLDFMFSNGANLDGTRLA